MATPDGFTPVLFLLGLVCLLATVVTAAWVIIYLRQVRRETIDRQSEMARLVRTIESRLDGLEANRGKPTGGTTRVDDAGDALPKARREQPGSPATGRRAGPGPRSSPTLIAVPALAAPSSEPNGSTYGGLAERHAEILALASAGSSPSEIARRTGQPVGQVELVLGLHRQIHSSRGPSDHARPD
jgi:hypothetical protein